MSSSEPARVGTAASLYMTTIFTSVMIGERTLFSSAEAVERLWEVSTPLLADPPPVPCCPPGSWGPPEAGELIVPGRWHLEEDG